SAKGAGFYLERQKASGANITDPRCQSHFPDERTPVALFGALQPINPHAILIFANAENETTINKCLQYLVLFSVQQLQEWRRLLALKLFETSRFPYPVFQHWKYFQCFFLPMAHRYSPEI
ncbi:MAG: hypothetical protein AB7U34_11015, partial [Novosphingobium sp.]